MEIGLRCMFDVNHGPKRWLERLTNIQKFQDLEEERLDFTKSSIWTYANIASTVCVSDDAVCVDPC
jgi:hypothetical protein